MKDSSASSGVRPPLTVGAIVRVYPTSSSSPLWLHDPATGQPADIPPVTEATDFEVGTIRERSDDLYRVTVRRRGVEYYLDWTARYWVRQSHEPAPGRPAWDTPSGTAPEPVRYVLSSLAGPLAPGEYRVLPNDRFRICCARCGRLFDVDTIVSVDPTPDHYCKHDDLDGGTR